MANNVMFPVRMTSSYDDSYLHGVVYQANDEDAIIEDGALVVLGEMAPNPAYSAAWTSATGADTTVIDINTSYATAPAAATATHVCVIDLANIPTATNGDLVYRIGVDTIGLMNPAGNVSRAREMRYGDRLMIGEGNIEGGADLVVGQYATATAGKTTWTPAAAAPDSGFYAKVISKEQRTRGIGIGEPVTVYLLRVLAN